MEASKAIIINFNGFSEADDICYVVGAETRCLSNVLRGYYDNLKAIIPAYMSKLPPPPSTT